MSRRSRLAARPRLERLDDRQGFDLEKGTVQPYNKAFMTPTANR